MLCGNPHTVLTLAAAIALSALTACTGAPVSPLRFDANGRPELPPGSKPISEVPGVTQSLSQFCKSKPVPKLPNGQQSLDAVCAPAFIKNNPAATVKTVTPSNVSVLMFGNLIKIDEVCGASAFKAPMCKALRPGDRLPAISLHY